MKPVRLPLASFQKWWALCCQLFKRELFIINLFAGFQKQQDCPFPVSKALCGNSRNLSSNRSKGFEFAGLEKLSANSTAFGT
jgi:hypothetical protein